MRQFDSIVWKGLGLDRHPELRDMYFGNYDRVVYLAQSENPELDAAAEVAAARLGLRFERRFNRIRRTGRIPSRGCRLIRIGPPIPGDCGWQPRR